MLSEESQKRQNPKIILVTLPATPEKPYMRRHLSSFCDCPNLWRKKKNGFVAKCLVKESNSSHSHIYFQFVGNNIFHSQWLTFHWYGN